MHKNSPRRDLHAPKVEAAVVFKGIKRDDPCLEGVVRADRKNGHDFDDRDVLHENGPNLGWQVGDDCVHDRDA